MKSINIEFGKWYECNVYGFSSVIYIKFLDIYKLSPNITTYRSNKWIVKMVLDTYYIADTMGAWGALSETSINTARLLSVNDTIHELLDSMDKDNIIMALEIYNKEKTNGI